MAFPESAVFGDELGDGHGGKFQRSKIKFQEEGTTIFFDSDLFR